MQTTLTASADVDTRHKARRGLAIYFTIVALLSAPIQALIIYLGLEGGTNGLVAWLVLISALMFVPTISSVVARLFLKEGFSDVSFRFGGRRGRNAILLALVFPLVVGLVAYGIGWATGLVGFRVPPTGLGGWAAAIAVLSVLNVVLSSGEEIGWRGYMLTRLIDAGVPRPVFASGLIWGLWHVPLVLWAGFADGPSPLLSAVLLTGTAVTLGYVLARVRLETGSVWPAVALHAAWNVIIQAGFDPATTGATRAMWVGEAGVLTLLVLVVGAAILSRGRWTIVRTLPASGRSPVQRSGVRAQPRVQ
jgi:membrane protease YdiL (CAAX protease family)